MRIEYCPTDEMVSDFMTKPLQGKKFRDFRKMMLNLSDEFVDYKSTNGIKGIKSPRTCGNDDNRAACVERQECVGNSTVKYQDQDQNRSLIEDTVPGSYLAAAQGTMSHQVQRWSRTPISSE